MDETNYIPPRIKAVEIQVAKIVAASILGDQIDSMYYEQLEEE